jgi:hypothetical protein
MKTSLRICPCCGSDSILPVLPHDRGLVPTNFPDVTSEAPFVNHGKRSIMRRKQWNTIGSPANNVDPEQFQTRIRRRRKTFIQP